MNIVICDDDKLISDKLKEDIRLIYTEMNVPTVLSVFLDGKSLIEAVQKHHAQIDMLLLDIDMPGVSGLEVARKLREINQNIILIFISSHEGYVFESLEYSPFRYIRKQRIKEELHLALRAAYALFRKSESIFILVKCENGEQRIDQSKICYFNIDKRKLYIHLEDNRVLCTWKTVKEFHNELVKTNFVKIHSGCAVNMKYIKEYSHMEVVLDNGERLLASRSGIKSVKEALSRYWSERV